MTNYLDFIKQLFFVMLYLTGIIACFFIMVGLIETTFEKKTNKKNLNIKAINMSDLELDEETEKAINKIAEKLANKYVDEMISDDYEKED